MAVVVDCPHAAACGGCPLIALPYDAQLEHKLARVATAFARFALLASVPIAPVAAAEKIVAYRSRAKLVVGPAGIGLYGGGGHDLVDLPECKVLPEATAALVARLRAYLRAGELHAHDGASLGIRGVDLRGTASDEGALVTLIVDDDPSAREQAEQIARKLASDESSRIRGVFVAPHPGDSPRLLAPGAYLVTGTARVEDRVGDTRYLAGPGAFVQANREQAARVHAIVGAHANASNGARVLDLYAGGGGIGLALARSGAKVTLVESYAPAMEDARASAELNGVSVETIAADAEGALDGLLERKARFETVVLNPPRRGCAPGVREKVARLGPQRIAYVSCDPETLGRDLDHFRRLGYATNRAEPLDMIPLTDEVETVALLTRAPPPHPPVLYEDESLLVISKWPDEPLAPQRDRAISTLERVRRRSTRERAVALFAPDEGSSGVCVLVNSGGALASWQSAGVVSSSVIALVRGVTHPSGSLGKHRGGAAPTARYRRLGVAGGQSLLRISVEGASSARVRQDLAAIAHPVVGDDRYGHAPTNRHVGERFTLSRPFLHVERVEITDPGTRSRRSFETALAADLVLVLERMGARELMDATAAPPPVP